MAKITTALDLRRLFVLERTTGNGSMWICATTEGFTGYLKTRQRTTDSPAYIETGPAALSGSVQEPQPAGSTGIGPTFQMFSLYSLMARSDENRPMRAVFRMDIRHHCPASRQARSTCAWHAT